MSGKRISQRVDTFRQKTERLKSTLAVPAATHAKAEGGRVSAAKLRHFEHKPITGFKAEREAPPSLSPAQQTFLSEAKNFSEIFGESTDVITSDTSPKNQVAHIAKVHKNLDSFVDTLPAILQELDAADLAPKEKEILLALTEQLEASAQASAAIAKLAEVTPLAEKALTKIEDSPLEKLKADSAAAVDTLLVLNQNIRQIAELANKIFDPAQQTTPQDIQFLNRKIDSLNSTITNQLTIIENNFKRGPLTDALENASEAIKTLKESTNKLLGKNAIQTMIAKLFDKDSTFSTKVGEQIEKTSGEEIRSIKRKITGVMIAIVLLTIFLLPALVGIIIPPLMTEVRLDPLKKRLKQLEGSMNNIKLLLDKQIASFDDSNLLPMSEFSNAFKAGMTTREIKVKNKETQEIETKTLSPIVDEPYIDKENKNTLLHQLAYTIAKIDDDETNLDFLVEDVLLHSIILAEKDSEKAPEELKKYLTLKNTDGEMFVDILPEETKAKLLKKLRETTIGFKADESGHGFSLQGYLPPELIKRLSA